MKKIFIIAVIAASCNNNKFSQTEIRKGHFDAQMKKDSLDLVNLKEYLDFKAKIEKMRLQLEQQGKKKK